MRVKDGTPVDFLSRQGHILPVMGELQRIDSRTYQSWRKRNVDKLVVLERDLIPLWGPLDEVVSLQGARNDFNMSGQRIRRNDVLQGRKGMSLDHSVAIGSNSILRSARDSSITSSLLVGPAVLGRFWGGENPPKFNERQFDTLIALADGIRDDNMATVTDNLTKLQSLLAPGDSNHSHLNPQEVEVYRDYGKQAGIARLVDSFYIPAIRRQESAANTVDNSVVYGSVDVFSTALGAKISDSIIGVNSPDGLFRNAHLIVDNSILVEGDYNVTTLEGRTCKRYCASYTRVTSKTASENGCLTYFFILKYSHLSLSATL
jgi:hypothetical protein